MAKITFAGETVDMDLAALHLHEALALQKATGMRPPQLGEALAGQDMLAIAALIWLILKFRLGKPELTFDEVCDGTYDIDLSTFKVEDDPEPDPTGGVEAEKTSTVNA